MAVAWEVDGTLTDGVHVYGPTKHSKIDEFFSAPTRSPGDDFDEFSGMERALKVFLNEAAEVQDRRSVRQALMWISETRAFANEGDAKSAAVCAKNAGVLYERLRLTEALRERLRTDTRRNVARSLTKGSLSKEWKWVTEQPDWMNAKRNNILHTRALGRWPKWGIGLDSFRSNIGKLRKSVKRPSVRAWQKWPGFKGKIVGKDV